MLDILVFVLAALPIVTGLAVVLLAFRERIQTSAAHVKAIGRSARR